MTSEEVRAFQEDWDKNWNPNFGMIFNHEWRSHTDNTALKPTPLVKYDIIFQDTFIMPA